ncbi:MAG: protoporphyrinogen oxidase [Acidobacteria bacterium]|nr:protoporphyrinogen oxidase [Acidobacteriota bacterium]
MSHVAIVGGGIAGLSAAYELAKRSVPFQIFEASHRFGGIVETEHHDGFVMECGPDGWITEKPWARELAIELGLADDLIASNDATRITWIYRDGQLHAIPEGMRMMVPTNLNALRYSALFSQEAIEAYEREPSRAHELKQYAADHAGTDESVANFIRRHFGEEVTRTIAAPLLAGVFGGDVGTLSAEAVMPQFVSMEREHGSLINALTARTSANAQPVFTSLRNGLGTLIDSIVVTLPQQSQKLHHTVAAIKHENAHWHVEASGEWRAFDHLILATPAHVTRTLLSSIDTEAAALLDMPASSAVLVALAFTAEQSQNIQIPAGFGFLVPPKTQGSGLLAATFVDQKFPHRVPPGGRLLRAFFGSATAEQMQSETDAYIAAVAHAQLCDLLGTQLPEPSHTVVRRWPQSLPQYTVGHRARMRRLDERIALQPALTLLGNAYRGVGLPDLIRDGRATAASIAT